MNDTLNTNEVKNAAGTEVEFVTLDKAGRKHVWGQSGETYSLPHRITLSHTETGSGMKKRKRSLLRVDKTTLSGVDSTTPITNSAYIVLDTPVGAMTANTEAANVLAELTSLVATGGTSTFLYDGTGTAAVPLLNGGLN